MSRHSLQMSGWSQRQLEEERAMDTAAAQAVKKRLSDEVAGNAAYGELLSRGVAPDMAAHVATEVVRRVRAQRAQAQPFSLFPGLDQPGAAQAFPDPAQPLTQRDAARQKAGKEALRLKLAWLQAGSDAAYKEAMQEHGATGGGRRRRKGWRRATRRQRRAFATGARARRTKIRRRRNQRTRERRRA